MGKTVWLDLFCANPGDGFAALKMDFEGIQTSEEFLLRAVRGLHGHQGLPRRARAKLASLFDGIEVAAASITIKKGVSTRAATDLLSDTVDAVDEHLEPGELLVIAMDEVPIAVGNIAETEGAAAAHNLLQTLRALRRRDSALRWIVCGSVGFHHILRRCGATEGVVNDLVNLPLGPLEPPEAAELAERLFLGIDREAGAAAVTSLVEHSGRIPFLIHALAQRLHDAGTGPVSAGDVAEAFVAFMDDRDDSRAVTHLLTRLDPLYGAETDSAKSLLDRVAVDGALPVQHLGRNSQLIDDLIDDHYLIESRGTVGWRYDVLRRIWMHRRRLG